MDNFFTIYHLHTPGGILIAKDDDNAPIYKVIFTLVLDKLMDLRTPVTHRFRSVMKQWLSELGFAVRSHEMREALPFPYGIYMCTQPKEYLGQNAEKQSDTINRKEFEFVGVP